MSIQNLFDNNFYSLHCKNIDIDKNLLFAGNKGDIGDIIVINSDSLPEWKAPPSGLKGDKGDTGSKGDKGDKGDTGSKGDQASNNYSSPAVFRINSEDQNIGELGFTPVIFDQVVRNNTDIVIQTTTTDFEIQQTGLYQIHVEIWVNPFGPGSESSQLKFTFLVDGVEYFSDEYKTQEGGTTFITSPYLTLQENNVFNLASAGISVPQPVFPISKICQISFVLIN
jgi:hypothetical protein